MMHALPGDLQAGSRSSNNATSVDASIFKVKRFVSLLLRVMTGLAGTSAVP